jgi:hypothetical protein
MTKWRYNLRNSKDLSIIGELTEASGKSLTLAHNTPGSANWNYPMTGQWANLITAFSTCISAERYNWRASLALNQGGTPGQVWDWIWSGFVMPIDEDWTNNVMKVSCVGWAQRLAMRMIRRDITWTGVDDAKVLQDLLAEMNLAAIPYQDGSTYTVPTVAGSNPNTPTWMTWGGAQPNQGPGGATAYIARTDAAINAPITITKQRYQMVLPMWDELAQLESGLDWWVDPKTRTVYVYRKKCTVRNVVVAFKWGPNNLGLFSRNIAADQKANCHITTGQQGIAPGIADNVADQAINGLIDGLTQLNDVNNTNYLVANSGAEILLRQNGKITYGITPFAYVGDINRQPNSVPEPFVDYDPVWDELKLSAISPKRGNIDLQTVRCYGCTINIDEENNEQLGQLQVAP